MNGINQFFNMINLFNRSLKFEFRIFCLNQLPRLKCLVCPATYP